MIEIRSVMVQVDEEEGFVQNAHAELNQSNEKPEGRPQYVAQHAHAGEQLLAKC